jgi:hypothetical protein
MSVQRYFRQLIEWFESIGDDVLEALAPLGRQIAKAGGKALIDAALAAVLAAETAGGSGDEKFDAAHKAVVKTLQAQGLPIITNAINGAIEIAVAKIRE